VLAVRAGETGTGRYRDRRSGEERSESAPRLILAAGGLDTQIFLFDARDGHGALPDLPATLGRRFSLVADLAVLLRRAAVLGD
jgi:cholesterol oxidase